MSRRKVSPEATIIALFTGLSDESKRMVMFGLNAIQQQNTPQPQKRVLDATQCRACGLQKAAIVHDMDGDGSHPFAGPGTAPPVRKRSSRKGAVIASTANTEDEAVSATAASGD